jgi:hypothetical protein
MTAFYDMPRRTRQSCAFYCHVSVFGILCMKQAEGDVCLSVRTYTAVVTTDYEECRAAFVITDVSMELIASIFRVERMCELATSLAVHGN